MGHFMRERLLRVEAPHFVAGAIYAGDPWQCVRAAPIIRWMVGKPPRETRAYLDRKGWKFQWI